MRSAVVSAGPRQVERASALDVIARRLRVSRAESDGRASPELLAEVIRETVFRYALHGDGETPVHVLTILNQVRRQLAPIWPDLGRSAASDWAAPQLMEQDLVGEAAEEESPIRRYLDLLSMVGDLQHLGSGYWLPTPTRLVAISNEPSSLVLILGGAPLYQLLSSGYVSTNICGSIRALPRKILPRSLLQNDAAWQQLDDWLEAPSEPIRDWTVQKLLRSAGQLLPSHSDTGAFEVYEPLAHPRDSQFFRWTPARLYTPSHDRLSLCRAASPINGGSRRYWIGRLAHRDGVTQVISECAVAGRDIRRLQYGLDALAGAPTKGTVTYAQHSADVTLSSYLPLSERRLLSAVGEDVSHRLGRLPTTYRVPRDVVEPVLDYIGKLGIQWR